MDNISSRTMDFVNNPNIILILRFPTRRRLPEEKSERESVCDLCHHLFSVCLMERSSTPSGYSDGINHSFLSDDSDEEFCANLQQRHVSVPNTDRLDKHEISFATKQACGITDSSSKQNLSIASMIQKRTIGPAFSTAEKCWISNSFLPNKFDLITKYNSRIYCGSYSKDGNFFLTATQDSWLRVYNTHNGKFTQLKSIPARDVGWSILDTAFSPDGSTIVYSSWSECLYQCSVSENSTTQESLLLGPGVRRFCVFSLVFSNDGREILGGANDGKLYVYDRECRQRVLRVAGHYDDVNAVAFADNTSQIFYSAGDDGLCKVWDKRTLTETDPRPVGVLAGHMDGITYIDSRGDSRYLITNCKDQTIKLWDVRVFSGEIGKMNTRKAVSSQNWDYRWQPVPKRLRKPRDLLEGDTSVMTYRGHSVLQTLIRCHFSPADTTGQRYIYTGCSTGRVIVYDVLTGKIVRKLFGHAMCVRDVSWHPFYPHIVSTSWDSTIARWRYVSDAKYISYSDMEDTENEIEIQPQKLRRSERIAAQQARNATFNSTS
ncbi:DDB1- and CUL4-associated factor 11 isoform X2 [Harpegnathos saltator]|uniref:DDB1- and CUL4-associated factor 11 isoform X2 n=1 Tax=Harpegnathos saltator TaxID=610380 RepID=UPI000DBEE81C|nr:DDB1- and CUL4-associated factor 11 isoform X2 [Harpegnathos saltator]